MPSREESAEAHPTRSRKQTLVAVNAETFNHHAGRKFGRRRDGRSRSALAAAVPGAERAWRARKGSARHRSRGNTGRSCALSKIGAYGEVKGNYDAPRH